MHLPLLDDILILLSFSVIIVFFLQRIKLPSILGFLITGVLIGPNALSLVEATEQVEMIAELGIILLLFVIGMELSIRQLSAMRKTVFLGGIAQVGLTALMSAVVYKVMGYAWNQAVFIGFLFSLSSTAIVLKLLQGRNEITTPHGRNTLAILIFQDIIVVPMMLVTPILGGASDSIGFSLLSLLLKTTIVLAITFVSARYLVPRLMHAIALTRSKELFLLTTIFLCFAVAFLTSQAGLSLALGAFLAGLIISESEYSHQATSIILPFRELFTSFFFISVGMLMDVTFFLENLAIVLGAVLLVFVVKSVIAAGAIALLRYPPRTAILTGLSLFQVGEFSFILSKVGIEYGLLNEYTNQLFLSISIISMLLTPMILTFSDRWATTLLKRLAGLGWGKSLENQSEEVHNLAEVDIKNHLIIIGYGLNGYNLARAATSRNIPFIIIELNGETVKKARSEGVPILFGDATEDHILHMAHLEAARAVVVAISDPNATKRIVSRVRFLSSSVYLVVRTRYTKDSNELFALGADDVVPEEFETSVEIFSRVLHKFLVPMEEIQAFTEEVRHDNYQLFDKKASVPKTFRSAKVPDFNITCMKVIRDNGSLLKQELQELDLRNSMGINILAIQRKGELLDKIKASDKILRDDLLYVNGQQEDIERFHKLLR